MASVRIVSGTFKRSNLVVTGSITIEVTFSSSEITNNIGFVPRLFVQGAHATCRTLVLMGPTLTDMGIGRPVVTLADLRREVEVPLKEALLRPNGQPTVTETYPVAAAVDALFKAGMAVGDAQSKADKFFSIETGLDARVELWAEISASQHTATNQIIAK